MRITAGEFKGRKIQTRPADNLRPTTGRVREALFNTLMGRISGAKFLDLFAGTGIVGLEALSRGAALTVFVEKNPHAAAAIKHNLGVLDLLPRGTVYCGDVVKALRQVKAGYGEFDLIFADPPYEQRLSGGLLDVFFDESLLAFRGWLIIESSERNIPPEGMRSFLLQRRLKYGETILSYYQQEAKAV